MSKGDAASDVDVDPLDTIEEHEYPDGLRLAAIVTALVLSIFLASLDTVRQDQMTYAFGFLTRARPSSPPLSLLLPMTSTVSQTWAGMARQCSFRWRPHSPCGGRRTNISL
jgi:hypothetical protein